MELSQTPILTEQLGLIKSLIYSEKLSIPVWRTRTARYTQAVEYTDYSPWSEMKLGDHWTCNYDDARWFEATVTVPESFVGKHLVLELNMGGEGMVTVNGKPMGSLAFYHRPDCYGPLLPLRHRTRIELGAVEGKLDISVQLNMNYRDHYKAGRFLKYDGTQTTTYRLTSAALCVVDDDTEAFYFDAANVMDAMLFIESPADTMLSHTQSRFLTQNFENILFSMNRDGALASKMRRALMLAFLELPFGAEDDKMRRRMPQAAAVLKKQLAEMPEVQRGTVYINGLAHLDIVWLWQEKHSVRKIANTIANTLQLAERYPEYVFTLSQPYVFEWVEKHYPQLFEKLKEKVASGNIDPVGNLWVEMDCNLAGGESIIRQLLYGRAYYMEKFGKSSDVFLIPDSFGYNAALPQIVQKSGIKYFLTAKLHLNETYRFPHTLFMWEGIDGSRIPTYLIRNPYSSDMNSYYLSTVYARQERNDLMDAACLCYGFGDGGGGPDYVMLENARRMTNMPGIPKAKHATIEDFFRAVTTNTQELPVWSDELYFDRHRGTYTTQAQVKKNNRKAELALRRTEIAASVRAICQGIAYPRAELEQLWKMLLHLQFHDTLPGSSITPVYEDTQREFTAFFEKQEALFAEILADLTAGTGMETAAWNFLPWERKFTREDRVLQLPSVGWSVESAPGSLVSAGENELENKFFRIRVDAQGRMVSLWDKRLNREMLKAPSNVLQLFEDPARATLSAWDINPEYNYKTENLVCDSVKPLPVTETTAGLELTWHFGNSTVIQQMRIYSDIDRIDFETYADWQENMRLLKAAFYPKVHANQASYEIQFGAIRRATHRNTDYDAMRFEGCAHKWADLSQADMGLSILNDSKYGYDILGDRMRITLLRAPVEPDYKADRGEHRFTYSLYPHRGSWEQGGTVRAGFELNEPVFFGKAAGQKAPVPQSFVTVEHPSVVLDTFKQAEDGKGYIVRVYESAGAGGEVKLRFAKDIKALYTCNMMEQENVPAVFDGGSFEFETTPYCIHTYRVEF